MRKLAHLTGTVLLLALFCLAASCSATRLVDQWRDPEFKGGPYASLFLVAVSPSPGQRRSFEDQFAKALQPHGVHAKVSYRTVSDQKAADPVEFVQAARKEGMGAILVTHYLGSVTREEYVPPTVHPTYYYGFMGYYPFVYEYVHQPGYYVERRYLRLETNLYDVKTGQLVWSAASATLEPLDMADLTRSLAGAVVEQLKAAGLIG